MTRSLFREVTGFDPEVVSTIDHPYPSPPIHLFDGHLNLQRRFGQNALLVNWDVSQPLERFYRYDLVTDTALIAKNPSLYLYEHDTPYSVQSLGRKPWELLPDCIGAAASALRERTSIPYNVVAAAADRALSIARACREQHEVDIPPASYTKKLLLYYYERIEQGALVDFIRTCYVSFWHSTLRTRWIPWCLRNVTGELSLSSLVAGKVFRRRLSRSASISPSPEPASPSLSELANQVEDGTVIPSLDLFLWSLAVAGVPHYGNDFGFFQRAAAASGTTTLAGLQLTGDEEDCHRFLRFTDDHGVLLDIDPEGRVAVSARKAHAIKLTRTNTFNAAFVALGEEAIPLLSGYADGRFSLASISLDGSVHTSG